MNTDLRRLLLDYHEAPGSVLECLGWTLLHSLWQGVVWGVGLVVLLWCVPRVAPRVRHHIILMFMLCFVAGAAGTFASLFPEGSRPGSADRPSARAVAPAVLPGPPAITEERMPLTGQEEASVGESGTGVEKLPLRWQVWAAWSWILGVSGLLLWRSLGWIGVRRIRRQSRPASGELLRRFEALKGRLGVRRRIPLLVHAHLKGVFLCGVLRPFVVVPAAMANGMPMAEMEALLMHELAHWQRRDPWIRMVQMMCEIALCHHPVTWWMSRQLTLAREMATDDMTVSHLGQRERYTLALVHAAEWHASLPAALGAAETGLPARISRLLNHSAGRTPIPNAWPLTGLVAVGLSVVFLHKSAVGQNAEQRLHPGDSIQAAIDAAPSGATLILAEGEFAEFLTISKPLTLRGAGWDKTRIKPKADGRPTVLVEKTSDVTVEQLSLGAIAPEEDQGTISDTGMLEVRESQKVKLSQVAAIGPGWSGVTILGSEDVALTDSLCCGLWGTGVVVRDSKDKACKAITIERCVLRHCHYAGMTLRSSGVLVRHCRLSGASWHGIRYDHCAPTVTNNEIFFNYRSGIYASGKTKAVVTGNLIYDNNFNAVSCWFSNEDTYEGNTFAGNQREGIAILDGSTPAFRRNIVALSHTGLMLGRTSGPESSNAKLPVLEDNYFWSNTVPMTPAPAADAVPPGVKPQEQAPGFVDAGKSLYFLTEDSPLRPRKIGAAADGPLPDPFPLQAFERKIQKIRIDEDARERSEVAAREVKPAAATGFDVKAVSQEALQLESREVREAAIEKIRRALGSAAEEERILGLQAFMQVLPVEFDKKSFRPLILPMLESKNAAVLRQACYALNACGPEAGDLDRLLTIAENPPPGMRDSLSHLLFVFSKADLTGKAGDAVLKLLNDGGATREVLRGVWGAQFSPALEEKVIALSKNADGTTNHDPVYFALSPQANKSEKSIRRLIEILADPDVVNNAGRAAWGLKQGVSKEHYDLVANAALNLLEARSDDSLRHSAVELLTRYAGEKQIPAVKKFLEKPNLDTALREALEKVARR